MLKSTNIHQIIASKLLGSISQEDEEKLRLWLDESEENRAKYARFMNKSDIPFLLSRVCKDTEEAELARTDKANSRSSFAFYSWAKIAVAACALLFVGFYVWQSYFVVEVPVVPQNYLDIMQQSKSLGRTDADVNIVSDDADARQLISNLKNITDEGTLNSIVERIISSNASYSAEKMQAEIVTHHDKEFWLTLPDGTRVHLNYNSSLTYPLSFSGKNRDVELQGEAYFFVAKDHRHPFIVHTRYGDVKEYGTEFVINTRFDSKNTTGVWGVQGKGLSVVLVNGSISVIPEGGKETMMKPNDLAVVSEGSTQPHIKQVDTEPFTSWNTGTFSFDNCPLDRLIDVISRWHGMTVDIRNKQAMHKGFTGELDRYGDIHSQLNAIGNITGAKIYVEDHTIVIE